MAFIHKDYTLADGKVWTLRGWYHHGLQEMMVLLIALPLASLIAWGAYTMISKLSQIYPELARSSQVYFWVCAAIVPFSGLVVSRFLWWSALVTAALIYALAPALTAWALALLLLSVPFRCVWAWFCHLCREGSAPPYVHVIGVSGWR